MIADVIVLRIQLRGVRRGPRTDAEETEIVTETDADATEIEIETVTETDAAATETEIETVTETDADATETVIETDADAISDAVVTVISAGSILSIRMFQRLLYDSLF